MIPDYNLNTRFGEIEVREARGYWRTGIVFELDGIAVEVESPAQGDDQMEWAELSIENTSYPLQDIERLIKVVGFAGELVRMINACNADAVAAVERAEQELEEREAEERAAKDARTEERKQMLLNELMGETVRVRHDSYRTTAKALVEAYEGRVGVDYAPDEEPTFLPRLKWDSANNANRRRTDVENWMLLDVKTDKGWRNVWDDGKHDIGERVGASRERIKPWTGGLR
jgi:hypothetical protein